MRKIMLMAAVALTLLSCKDKQGSPDASVTENQETQENQETSQVMENANLPYNSKSASQYYKQDTKSSDYLVVPGGKPAKHYEDGTIPVKEDEFGYTIAKGGMYYDLESFNFPGVNCKLFIYNVAGENDASVLNIQLNSYDKNNKLKDALLLDTRFTFETEYYRDFVISKAGVIDIKKVSVFNLAYNEQGDIVGERASDSTSTQNVRYQIENDGKFIKQE